MAAAGETSGATIFYKIKRAYHNASSCEDFTQPGPFLVTDLASKSIVAGLLPGLTRTYSCRFITWSAKDLQSTVAGLLPGLTRIYSCRFITWSYKGL